MNGIGNSFLSVKGVLINPGETKEILTLYFLKSKYKLSVKLVKAAFDFTANIRDLPKELLLRTKQTLRQAGGTNEHNDIVNLETAQQIWSINQPYAKNAISAMIDKISSKN